MIRTVIIMSSSGLVLFIKQYVHSIRQPRMVGSLLIAMLEFSMVTAGMPVSYIELTGLGVTVVWNEAAKVFCALFLDREDGADFGRLLATEILAGFQDEYANELGSAALNLVDFSGFHSKLLDAIQRTAQPVLGRLVQAHGVLKAVLITESSQTFQTADIDQLGLLANLGALAGLSTDIMAHCGDSVRTLTLEGDARGNSRVLVWRVEQSTLVVAASRAVTPAHYQPAVDEAVDMLLRLARVLGSLR